MLAALFVGLVLGGSGYHIFFAPTLRLRSAKLGMLVAAKELRAWLDWAPAELKERVESSMIMYNLERAVARLQKFDASDVARKKEGTNGEEKN